MARANQGADFAKTSISRRIPTLVHDGFSLSGSSAICEYLDETFPGTRLSPTDPRDVADISLKCSRFIVSNWKTISAFAESTRIGGASGAFDSRRKQTMRSILESHTHWDIMFS